MEKVNFIKMEDGTAEEYLFLDKLEDEYKKDLPNKIIASLERLEDSLSGYQISRLDHVLQAATRAHQAGESEQWIIAALLHDIGDELAPYSHSEMAAAILRPFVNEEVYWVVKHHGIFQMYYYAHHSGGNRNARERYKDHPFYDSAVRFCHEYDQNCFDPEYESKSLDFFKPILERVLDKPLAGDAEHQARYGS
ncbi:HD domain-containing protein [uncultured Cocleimonas sp.]|uniref:HD domain-containing protein n=1 Tax=uncultured Cocleimonas sp. TaxID=1051587 RepID=UPI0026312A55|nr:HD domain-containing protein [uncultured Cocleimonas sp.]